MVNNSLKEIAETISAANSILLYPHVNMDGDALGSCVALCKALRQKGKIAYVLIEDDIPENLKFLDKGYCTLDDDIIKDVDISMCIDCSDTSRFEARKEKFLEGKTTICIDHHRTTKPFCNLNYIDSTAAATGELIYLLLQNMNIEGDPEIGEAIFAAITTDTGNFQYSNTTSQSHEIVADLYNWGIDANKASVEIYENVRLEKVMIKSLTLQNMELICGGKAAISFVTQKMLEETGATMDETEGVVEDLRRISGVEYGVLLKEHDSNRIKVSLRAKRNGDVASIAEKLGGGGHVKAAGCTINATLDEALKILKNEVVSAVEGLKNDR